MTSEIKNAFMINMASKLNPSDLLQLGTSLDNVPNESVTTLTLLKYKSSTVSLLLSIFLGALGADRFYIKDYLLGTVKLIMLFLVTFFPPISIVLTIWTIVDIFLCYKKTKKVNFKLLNENIQILSESSKEVEI